MVRSMRVVVAALIIIGPVAAQAANSVVVQSKAVSPGATNVQVGVLITNDFTVDGLAIPLEIRQVTPGSYITAMQQVWRERLALPGGPLRQMAVINRQYATTDGTCRLGGYRTATYSDTLQHPVASSPEGLMGVRLGNTQPGDRLAPGADVTGSLVLIINVTSTPGTFVIDTTCVDPANHLLFTGDIPSVIPDFTPGVITIGNQCPTITGLAANLVNAIVGVQATDTIFATDPESDPITYYLISGKGAVNPATGAWIYTPVLGDVPGFDVVVRASDRGPGQCAIDTFRVNVSLPNQPPIANDTALYMFKDEVLSDRAVGTDPDGDPVVCTRVGTAPPFHGAISAFDSVSGLFSYVPDAGYVGLDWVSFEVRDPHGLSDTGGIVIHVVSHPCNCLHHGDIVQTQDSVRILNVLDVVGLINYVFRGAPRPTIDPYCPHRDRGDINCDRIDDVRDVVFLISRVFRGGPPLCDPCWTALQTTDSGSTSTATTPDSTQAGLIWGYVGLAKIPPPLPSKGTAVVLQELVIDAFFDLPVGSVSLRLPQPAVLTMGLDSCARGSGQVEVSIAPYDTSFMVVSSMVLRGAPLNWRRFEAEVLITDFGPVGGNLTLGLLAELGDSVIVYDRVDELIKRLTDPDPIVREQAKQELIQMGQSVLEKIDKAMAKEAADSELWGRLLEVYRALTDVWSYPPRWVGPPEGPGLWDLLYGVHVPLGFATDVYDVHFQVGTPEQAGVDHANSDISVTGRANTKSEYDPQKGEIQITADGNPPLRFEPCVEMLVKITTPSTVTGGKKPSLTGWYWTDKAGKKIVFDKRCRTNGNVDDGPVIK